VAMCAKVLKWIIIVLKTPLFEIVSNFSQFALFVLSKASQKPSHNQNPKNVPL
jgi:hypothetical protein